MRRESWVYFFYVLLVFFVFRQYVFGNKVLFPANLLASFYTPWNSVTFPGWEHGIPNKPLGHDNIRYFYPVKHLVSRFLKELRLPLWNPYNFAGTPILADGQSAVFYPLTFLYRILPLPDAFSVMVMIVPFVCLSAMFALLRHFKLSVISSLFGSLAFAFSGFFSVQMEENPAISHTALWLPLLVLFLDNWLTKTNLRSLMLFTILTAVMIVAGFLQIAIYELIFLTAYVLWKISTMPQRTKDRKHRLLVFFVSLATAIFLAAPYLLPTWEAYRYSPRELAQAPEVIAGYLVSWSHIVTLFVPDWLGNPGTYNYFDAGSYYDKVLTLGVVSFVFALVSLFKKKTSFEYFLWTTFLVTLFFGISSPVTQWLYGLKIPIFSSMLPSRIFYLSAFSLSILAAFGFEHTWKNIQSTQILAVWKKIVAVSVGFSCIIFFFLILYMAELTYGATVYGPVLTQLRAFFVSNPKMSPALFTIAVRNTGASLVSLSLVLGFILFARKYRRNSRFMAIFTVCLLLLTSLHYFKKSLYVSERSFMYPRHPLIGNLQQKAGLARIGYATDESRIRANINSLYGLFSPEGLNPVFSFPYGQLLQAAQGDGRATAVVPRIEALFDLSIARYQPEKKHRITAIANLLGIRYIVERKKGNDTLPIGSLFGRLVWEDDVWYLWENTTAFPRAWFVPNAFVEKDPQKRMDLLFSPEFNPDETVILEEIPKEWIANPSREKSGQISITTYAQDRIELLATTEEPGFVFLSDAFFPGWKSKRDGNDVLLYRANYAFRAVYVPPGSHTVEFLYEPITLRYGLIGSLVGFLLLPILWLVAWHT